MVRTQERFLFLANTVRNSAIRQVQKYVYTCIVKALYYNISAFSRRAVVSYWRKYVHEVLVNRLGGLSLPRKSVVRLTDRPDMTVDVYRGRKTTMQLQHFKNRLCHFKSVLQATRITV